MIKFICQQVTNYSPNYEPVTLYYPSIDVIELEKWLKRKREYTKRAFCGIEIVEEVKEVR